MGSRKCSRCFGEKTIIIWKTAGMIKKPAGRRRCPKCRGSGFEWDQKKVTGKK